MSAKSKGDIFVLWLHDVFPMGRVVGHQYFEIIGGDALHCFGEVAVFGEPAVSPILNPYKGYTLAIAVQIGVGIEEEFPTHFFF